MSKKKYLLFNLFFFLLLIDNKALASCNFKTSNYISELQNPNSIKKISIEISNYRKYFIESMRRLTYKNQKIPLK